MHLGCCKSVAKNSRTFCSFALWAQKSGRVIFAKDCLLTLVKRRLALGSPGWSFVTMPKMAQDTGKWLLTAP